jgi:DNA-binding SARP family transcriptional activator
VALGGRNVPQSSVIDALWSDEEGDAALNALGVTVSRLRRLLDCPDAILVVDEQLTINSERCWVDAFEFDALVANFPSNCDDAGARRFIDLVMSLYRGPLLPAESGHRWTMQMRMRLRDRFVRFVERAGLRLERSGDFEGAIDCYRRGLDADDLAEEFYQGLMRCYLALRRPAEGMQVFRRLRQTLSVLLGIAPSPQSESLAAALQECGRVHSGGAGSGFQLAPE